ncbi:MAG: hypothetical protein KGO82_03845 [Bacteroidota bacterium]|nr:hypothetical protein [Bacteroidota bacterium]
MRKSSDKSVKKGYNEKNPTEPQGAFSPAASKQKAKQPPRSNTADKKAKQDRS